MLRIIKRLVIPAFRVGDNRTQADRRRYGQVLAQLQSKQEPARPAIAVIERVNAFEGVMAHHSPQQRRNRLIRKQRQPFGQLHLDFRFRPCALMNLPVKAVTHRDLLGSEYHSVRLVFLP